MEKIPTRIEKLLKTSGKIKEVAESTHSTKTFLSRTCLWEPSLWKVRFKLKELTYRLLRAYSSGELKHGALALIDADFPSIIINGNSPLHGRKLQFSTGSEITRRKDDWNHRRKRHQRRNLRRLSRIRAKPYWNEVFSEVVILQLFAYHVANTLGNDIDKPRNLAKSVTVE